MLLYKRQNLPRKEKYRPASLYIQPGGPVRHPYAIVDYIPLARTKNLFSEICVLTLLAFFIREANQEVMHILLLVENL
jgi:hypothetical protein